MPEYLVRNSFSIYHFRFILPIDLQHYTGKRELKKSLRTGDLKKATYYAQRLVYKVKPILTGCLMNFTEMKALLEKEYFKILAEEIETLNKVGPYDESVGEPSDLIDLDEAGIAESTQKLLGDASDDKLHAYKKMLVEVSKALRAHATNLSSYSPPASTSATPASTSSPNTAPLLSQLIIDFTRYKDLKRGWNEKTKDSYLATYDVLLELITDKPLDEITRGVAESFVEKLQKLPTNLASSHKNDGKTLEQILAEGSKDTISDRTVNNKLGHINTLLNYATQQGHLTRNPFSGLKIKETQIEARTTFTEGELERIFALTMKEDGYKFWVPLLLYYTGTRLEEITQLHSCDIFDDHIDINDNDGKKLKNHGSRRKIPLHPQLIALGFVEYAKKQPIRIFPNLTPDKYGKTSHIASKWFGRLRKELGMYNQKPKKDAHSFRHTFVNTLKQADVETTKIQAIVGHKDENITTGLYGKEYPVETLAEVVKLIPALPVTFKKG